ncbi:MAG: SDR family oxidoreductase, partial [Acetobacteraceae bacterium]|nr:SDR family oxidoreductase [Acetobacteraceae bacterium]
MAAALWARRVFVTGAGRGIGQAAAELLAERGAHVGVVDVDPTTAGSVAAGIGARGGRASPHVADLTDPDAFAREAAAFAAEAGGIDAVINNAMWIRYEPVAAVSGATLDRMLTIGVKAPVWGVQALLRHMDPQVGGAVINLASPAADQGYPNTAIYAAVKGGIRAMTRALAVELGPHGVRVNAVAPGAVPTPGARSVVDDAGYAARMAKT